MCVDTFPVHIAARMNGHLQENYGIKLDEQSYQLFKPYRAVNTLRLCYTHQSVNVV